MGIDKCLHRMTAHTYPDTTLMTTMTHSGYTNKHDRGEVKESTQEEVKEDLVGNVVCCCAVHTSVTFLVANILPTFCGRDMTRHVFYAQHT